MATDFWNGTGTWSTDNAAWSDNAPPGSTENTEIQTGTANLTSATTISALQVDAPANLELTTGGTLVATGTATVAGYLSLQNGPSLNVGAFLLTGNALVEIDGTNIGGAGGSTLTVGGTLTNSSTNGNGLNIGNSGITAGDTVTAASLNNTGVIQITGAGAVQSTVNITIDGGPAPGGGDRIRQSHKRCAAGIRQRPDRNDRRLPGARRDTASGSRTPVDFRQPTARWPGLTRSPERSMNRMGRRSSPRVA